MDVVDPDGRRSLVLHIFVQLDNSVAKAERDQQRKYQMQGVTLEIWHAVIAEISRAAYDYDNYKQIMGVIARRLQSEGENWRHVYKSLLLLEYMAKHGPQKV